MYNMSDILVSGSRTLLHGVTFCVLMETTDTLFSFNDYLLKWRKNNTKEVVANIYSKDDNRM